MIGSGCITINIKQVFCILFIGLMTSHLTAEFESETNLLQIINFVKILKTCQQMIAQWIN